MIKKMFWAFSWILFLFGLFFAVVVLLENGSHKKEDLLICLATMLPRFLFSAFYLAEDVWIFSVFGLISPIIVAAVVFGATIQAFYGNYKFIIAIEAIIFIIMFFVGFILHRRWLKSWMENAGYSGK